jgi:hypothetical protein
MILTAQKGCCNRHRENRCPKYQERRSGSNLVRNYTPPPPMLLPYWHDHSTNDIQFWGFIQLNLGIIAACAPPLKPLVGGVLRLPSTVRSTGRSNYGTNTIGGSKPSRIQSRIRGSTMGQNHGWVRTNSEIELDERSFTSETVITSKGDRQVSMDKWVLVAFKG